MVLPDFGTNDCGIRIGGLESEDIRTFLLQDLFKLHRGRGPEELQSRDRNELVNE